MKNGARFWVVVPAAGAGKRMAADRPKQYLKLSGKTVLEHTLDRLFEADIFARIVVALSDGDPYWPELPYARNARLTTVPGGKERADSVLSGLDYLSSVADQNDWVLVHDAARPCLRRRDIYRLIEQVKDDAVGGILALPVHDTLKTVGSGRISDSIDRSIIWRALTPQMFRLGTLRNALITALTNGHTITDEASAIEIQGGQPSVVEGCPDNIKITRPEDLALAGFYLEQQCFE